MVSELPDYICFLSITPIIWNKNVIHIFSFKKCHRPIISYKLTNSVCQIMAMKITAHLAALTEDGLEACWYTVPEAWTESFKCTKQCLTFISTNYIIIVHKSQWSLVHRENNYIFFTIYQYIPIYTISLSSTAATNSASVKLSPHFLCS